MAKELRGGREGESFRPPFSWSEVHFNLAPLFENNYPEALDLAWVLGGLNSHQKPVDERGPSVFFSTTHGGGLELRMTPAVAQSGLADGRFRELMFVATIEPRIPGISSYGQRLSFDLPCFHITTVNDYVVSFENDVGFALHHDLFGI